MTVRQASSVPFRPMWELIHSSDIAKWMEDHRDLFGDRMQDGFKRTGRDIKQSPFSARNFEIAMLPLDNYGMQSQTMKGLLSFDADSDDAYGLAFTNTGVVVVERAGVVHEDDFVRMTYRVHMTAKKWPRLYTRAMLSGNGFV